MGPLDDKLAVVTGAASGIGKAAALPFTHEGASVPVTESIRVNAVLAGMILTPMLQPLHRSNLVHRRRRPLLVDGDMRSEPAYPEEER